MDRFIAKAEYFLYILSFLYYVYAIAALQSVQYSLCDRCLLQLRFALIRFGWLVNRCSVKLVISIGKRDMACSQFYTRSSSNSFAQNQISSTSL